MSQREVIPVILTDDLEEVKDQLRIAIDSELVKVVQIDIIDGIFTDNITTSITALSELDYGDLLIDLHLMAREPIEFSAEIEMIKSRVPLRYVISQIEQMSSQIEYIEEIKKLDLKAGLSLNIFTPVSSIDNESWAQIDLVQLVAVEAGAQGRELNELIYEKIKKVDINLKKMQKNIPIYVDGGIKIANFNKLVDAGVNGLVIGSSLWQASNFEKIYKVFQAA